MKKIGSFILVILLILGLTACGSEDNKKQTSMKQVEKKINDENILIVYFSMPETTNPEDMSEEEANSTVVINGKVVGNTEYFANVIQTYTKGTIFRIEPETAYPTDHDDLVDLASSQQKENARPVIKEEIENIDQYETIFIGYPNWWGDMPMILYTFFDTYDLSGKTIIPFNTHGGSGFSDTVSSIKQLEPKASVSDQGLSISRNNIGDAHAQITAWLSDLMKE